jgi:hypothetical protein
VTKKTETAFVPCILLALLILCCGCGKKAWPTAQTAQDAFVLEKVQARKAEGCLQVEASLSGAAQNLQSVALILEALDAPCPGCPFQPSRSIEIPLSSPQITLEGGALRLSFCDIDPQKAHRLKLEARNVYAGIAAVRSDVVLVEDAEASQQEPH